MLASVCVASGQPCHPPGIAAFCLLCCVQAETEVRNIYTQLRLGKSTEPKAPFDEVNADLADITARLEQQQETCSQRESWAKLLRNANVTNQVSGLQGLLANLATLLGGRCALWAALQGWSAFMDSLYAVPCTSLDAPQLMQELEAHIDTLEQEVHRITVRACMHGPHLRGQALGRRRLQDCRMALPASVYGERAAAVHAVLRSAVPLHGAGCGRWSGGAGGGGLDRLLASGAGIRIRMAGHLVIGCVRSAERWAAGACMHACVRAEPAHGRGHHRHQDGHAGGAEAGNPLQGAYCMHASII